MSHPILASDLLSTQGHPSGSQTLHTGSPWVARKSTLWVTLALKLTL